MRNLVTIQKISKLTPIPDADKIELAELEDLGWQIVVQKYIEKEDGTTEKLHEVGKTVIYAEVDSVFPDKPEFEFLKPRNMRIKTIKLKKTISQGIIFPLSTLETTLEEGYSLGIIYNDGQPKSAVLKKLPRESDEQENIEHDINVIEKGLDVTDMIGVIKYEPKLSADLMGTAKGNFPEFMQKTDETRWQNLLGVLNQEQGTICYVSEKKDGSSVSFYIKDDVFGVCSRNLDLIETEGNKFWLAARQGSLEDKLRSLGGNWAIQGELVGEGIQGNKYNLKGIHFYAFNLFNIDTAKYADYEVLKQTLKDLDIKMVPVLDENFILHTDHEKLIELSTRKATLNPAVWAEGVVIRSLVEREDIRGTSCNRLSLKVINPQFLLKYNDD